MAKNKQLGQMLGLGAYGLGGYLFYKLGTRSPNPLFGETVQKFLLEIKGAFSKTANTAVGTSTGGAPPPAGTHPGFDSNNYVAVGDIPGTWVVVVNGQYVLDTTGLRYFYNQSIAEQTYNRARGW